MGFEPMTTAMRCSTDWAMKPHRKQVRCLYDLYSGESYVITDLAMIIMYVYMQWEDSVRWLPWTPNISTHIQTEGSPAETGPCTQHVSTLQHCTRTRMRTRIWSMIRKWPPTVSRRARHYFWVHFSDKSKHSSYIITLASHRKALSNPCHHVIITYVFVIT